MRISNCEVKLGHSFDWTVFKSAIESRNTTGFGSKVKVRKLGWFGKLNEGAAQKEDQLYKISDSVVHLLGGKCCLVPIDAGSPFGSCSTAVCLYVNKNILRKINVFATSPELRRDYLPSRAEVLMEEFNSHCSLIFGQPSVLLMDEGNEKGEKSFLWSDSDSIIKTSTFYRKIFVVMWEILQSA